MRFSVLNIQGLQEITWIVWCVLNVSYIRNKANFQCTIEKLLRSLKLNVLIVFGYLALEKRLFSM